MMRNKTLLAASTALFLAFETLLGIRFQIGDHGALLRFASVVVACLFCALFFEKSWAYLLTQLALLLTVCADWFLVLPSPPDQLPGMLFFSVAQLAYAARLYLSEEDPKLKKGHIPARAILSGVALLATALVLGKGTDAVALVSLFYYANLILNLVFSCTQFTKHPLIAVGFILFICCDTLVGLAFLDGYFAIAADSLLYRIIHPGFDLAWAFYLPSQMLLAVSLLPMRWKSITAPAPRDPHDRRLRPSPERSIP